MSEFDCSRITPISGECDCHCPGGGWCRYHQVRKDATLVALCQSNMRYRQAWNECRGPGQQRPLRQHKRKGPGGELRSALGCGKARSSRVDFAQMDRWGVDWCREHQSEILAGLVAGGIDDKAATRLLEIAINKAAQAKGVSHGD